MIGQTISHYKILEKLGQGGMGEVYLAEDTKLKRKVALKFLPGYFSSDKEIIKRFEREAQAAAALNHPNLVTIYEIGEFEGQVFIAMEYVKGGTLRDKMKNTSLNPPSSGEAEGCDLEEVINIAMQICQGLSKAHQAGIFHRDIKPENILIDEDGHVKIVDFGLAKLKGATKITKESSTPGTVHYMSPEQVMGEETDHRTDIWSLGVVMYEMISGELPFKGEFEQVVLAAIKTQEPKLLKGHCADTPDDLQQIVNKALLKQPEKRYQKINEISTDLECLTKGKTIGKTRAVKKISHRYFKERRDRVAAFVIIAFVILVSGSYSVYKLANKVIEVEDKTVAIMFIENKTGEEIYTKQANNLIPQIYDKLFANQENDLKFPSPYIKNQLNSMQESNSYNYKTAEKILNDARIKYRVTAVVQKSDGDLKYVFETTKPGKNSLVWQETITRPDSVTSDEFAQTIAEWIEACIWVDWHEGRIHDEFNLPDHLTSREVWKNYLSKNVHASKALYEGDYLWASSQRGKALASWKKAWELDPNYIVAATSYAIGFDLIGKRQKGLDILEQLRKRSSEYSKYEQLFLEGWYEFYIRTSDRGIRKFRELMKLEAYPALWYSAIGYSYITIGDYQNGAKMYEDLLKSGMNPKFDSIYRHLRITYNLMGLYKKAVKPLKIGLKRNPDSRVLMYCIIEQYLMLGNIKEADKWFLEYEKASRIQAENTIDGIGAFLRHFLIMGDFEKVDEYQHKALSDLDIAVYQKCNIAKSIFYTGKYNEAEKLLLDIVESSPKHLTPYLSLAYLYRSKRDYTNMLKYAKKAHELYPYTGITLQISGTFFCYHIARALSFTANNDSIQAQSEWDFLLEKSLVLQARDENYWRTGLIYSMKGDVESAIENLEFAFEKGYRDVVSYCYDPDLDNVRNDPRTKDRFGELLEKVKATYPALAKKEMNKELITHR